MRLPDGLLEQAQHLVRREPKRPKQASLRRAISTAYYALFHLLISEAVLNWKRAEDRVELARMFEHTHMRSICASKRDELNKEFKKKKRAGLTRRKQSSAVSIVWLTHSSRCTSNASLPTTIIQATGPALTFSRRLRVLPPHSKPGRPSGMRTSRKHSFLLSSTRSVDNGAPS